MKKLCALVTGASRGIGKAVAIKLASMGYNLIINYNKSKECAEKLARDLSKKYDIEAYPFKANMGSVKEIDAMVDFAFSKFKKIDVLVNNAGICVDKDFDDRTVGHFQETFQINVFGLFHLSKRIGDQMFVNKYGKIVNVSSDNSLNGFYPTTIDYDASKCAVNSLTKNLAIQYAPYVNVNAVAPGWVDTDMNKDILTKDIAELECGRILKRRIGKPEDIANLVSFLCSEESSYIDGEIICIDGGMF